MNSRLRRFGAAEQAGCAAAAEALDRDWRLTPTIGPLLRGFVRRAPRRGATIAGRAESSQCDDDRRARGWSGDGTPHAGPRERLRRLRPWSPGVPDGVRPTARGRRRTGTGPRPGGVGSYVPAVAAFRAARRPAGLRPARDGQPAVDAVATAVLAGERRRAARQRVA